MTKTIRTYLALTQDVLAMWLGISRASLALTERDHQPLPYTAGTAYVRLLLAQQGKVYDPAGAHLAVPPLPIPPPDPAPLAAQVAQCQRTIERLSRELETMRGKVAPYQARLAVVPALRAYTGEISRPALEESWLALVEGEAISALLDTCGAGPQRLLEARIAGLEREAEVLRELLAELPKQ